MDRTFRYPISVDYIQYDRGGSRISGRGDLIAILTSGGGYGRGIA